MKNPFKRSMLRRKARFIHRLLKKELLSSQSRPSVREIEGCLRSYYLAALGLNNDVIFHPKNNRLTSKRSNNGSGELELTLNKNQPWLNTYDELALGVLFSKHGIGSEEIKLAILEELKTTFHFKKGKAPYQPFTKFCLNTVHNLQINNSRASAVVYGNTMSHFFREAVDLNVDDLSGGMGSIWLLDDLVADSLSHFMGGRGSIRRNSIINVNDEKPLSGYTLLVPNSTYNSAAVSLANVIFCCMESNHNVELYYQKADSFRALHCTLVSVLRIAIECNEPSLLESPTLSAFIDLADKHNVDISEPLKDAFGMSSSFEPTDEQYELWGYNYMPVIEILNDLKPVLSLGGKSLYDVALGVNGESAKHFILDLKSPYARFAVARLLLLEMQGRSSNDEKIKGDEGRRCPVFMAQELMMVSSGLSSIPSVLSRRTFAFHLFFGDEFYDFPDAEKAFELVIANTSHYVITSLSPVGYYEDKILEAIKDGYLQRPIQLCICKDKK